MALTKSWRFEILIVLYLFMVTESIAMIGETTQEPNELRNDMISTEYNSKPEIDFLFDWRRIVEPCKYNLSWLSTNERQKDQPRRTNAKYTKMVANDIRVDGLLSSIVIQTYTSAGQKKNEGGDSWHAILTGASSQMAIVHDNMDGTYNVLFRIYENGQYKLEMLLEQSMCDGLRDPPIRWFEQGDMHGHFQSPEILGPNNDYILEKVIFGPFNVKNVNEPKFVKRNGCHKVDIFLEDGWIPSEEKSNKTNIHFKKDQTKPLNGCQLVWDSFGRWVNLNGEYIYMSKGKMNSSKLATDDLKYDTLWIYGDSVSHGWWGSSFRIDICKRIFKFCTHTYTFTYPERNYNMSQINFGLPFNKSRFLDPIGAVLDDPRMKTERSVLVINFGIHLILSLNFTELRDTVDKFAHLMEQKKADQQILPRVIWRTTTSTIPEAKFLRITLTGRFLTNHRIRLFNAYANWRLCSIGVNIFDVFAVTSSYPKACKDGLHFSQEAFNNPKKALEVYLQECVLKG